MTELVTQRTPSDCSICCLAMVSGATYEEAIVAAGDDYDPEKGMWSVQAALCRLGRHRDDFREIRRGFEISPEYFREIAWGRRAFLSVPSLNIENGWHHIYYDGMNIYDPSPKLKYTSWDQLKPVDLVIFRETFNFIPLSREMDT